MDVWQCGLLPTLASSSSNSHVCFVALKFLELTYCQSQLQKKTKLPRAARLCLSLSKLKLYINQFKKVQPSKKKENKMHLHFICWTFSPVRWSRIGTKFSRPIDALPVPRLVRRQCQSPQWHPKSIIHRLMVDLEVGIPTFPVDLFYMFLHVCQQLVILSFGLKSA